MYKQSTGDRAGNVLATYVALCRALGAAPSAESSPGVYECAVLCAPTTTGYCWSTQDSACKFLMTYASHCHRLQPRFHCKQCHDVLCSSAFVLCTALCFALCSPGCPANSDLMFQAPKAQFSNERFGPFPGPIPWQPQEDKYLIMECTSGRVRHFMSTVS